MSRIHRLFLAVLMLMCYSASAADDPITVATQFGDLQETSVYYGELQASETTDIHVPEMSGEYMMTVKEVLEDGTRVKTGETILKFDDVLYRKGLESAENELEVANAELEKTKFDLKNRLIDLDLDIQRKELELAKAKVMVVENSIIISKIELQKSKLAVKFAELELNQAKKVRREFQKEYRVSLEIKELKCKEANQKIQKERGKIEKAVLLAPCDGVVFKPFVRLNNEMGRVEKNKVVSPGDKLLEIPNLESFKGVVYINPSDNRLIKSGDGVKLFLTAFPDTPFDGVVGKKDQYPMTRNERLGRNDPEGELEENKVMIDVLGSGEVLRPGMTFRAEITTTIATQCLFIPRIAVSEEIASESWVMFVASSSKSEKRIVKTGRMGISFIEITGGLKTGDLVVLPSDPPPEEENDEE